MIVGILFALGFVSVLLNFRRFYGDIFRTSPVVKKFLLIESLFKQSHQMIPKEDDNSKHQMQTNP